MSIYIIFLIPGGRRKPFQLTKVMDNLTGFQEETDDIVGYCQQKTHFENRLKFSRASGQFPQRLGEIARS